MGKRKVSILEPAATTIAEIAFFIESKGLPKTAKKFIDEAFAFFEKLSDDILNICHPETGPGSDRVIGV